MKHDPYVAPEQLSGYRATDEQPRTGAPGPAPTSGTATADENRGKRAPNAGSGGVVGSGASAGGAGGPEDYDDDPQAGGGSLDIGSPPDAPTRGADAP